MEWFYVNLMVFVAMGCIVATVVFMYLVTRANNKGGAPCKK